MQGIGRLGTSFEPGKDMYRLHQPLPMNYRPKDTQISMVDHDLTVLTGGRTLDDIHALPSDTRRAILHKYLVTEEPILMQEPTGWSNEESIKRFILLKELLKEDKSRRNLLLEARRVLYEENSFIIYFDDFSRFLDDMLGNWEGAAAVETLLRHLTVRVKRDECQCGQLMKYMQHASYFAMMPQLQKISFEWFDPSKDLNYADNRDAPDDDSSLSSCSCGKRSITHNFWEDDCTDGSGDSSDTLRWESSEDDGIWSLDEDIQD
ncbi:hypothetical protein FBULB1_1420 [Fusarium bulbicola]|nr:hypothetical protein FBULB1_1420 [Fusarium bulbicola]